ncbi:thioredoxin [Candidatus Parcubacteria bacterium]|nr:MAG: thioredoxin [Candidatus Parcubacteria bacterium]
MKELSPETFKTELATSKIALVDFFATWCPPCKLLKTQLEPLADEMKDLLNFYTFNIDESEELTDEFAVSSVPTLIIFKGGIEHSRQVGALPKQALKQWIEKALA